MSSLNESIEIGSMVSSAKPERRVTRRLAKQAVKHQNKDFDVAGRSVRCSQLGFDQPSKEPFKMPGHNRLIHGAADLMDNPNGSDPLFSDQYRDPSGYVPSVLRLGAIGSKASFIWMEPKNKQQKLKDPLNPEIRSCYNPDPQPEKNLGVAASQTTKGERMKRNITPIEIKDRPTPTPGCFNPAKGLAPSIKNSIIMKTLYRKYNGELR